MGVAEGMDAPVEIAVAPEDAMGVVAEVVVAIEIDVISMPPPNKHMQRAGMHKVLGRGRLSLVPWSEPRARVLTGQLAGADVGRWASWTR